MRKKFWTVRDGVVGTAHKSRDGKEADFRPGWIVVAQKRDDKIEVRPAKGVAAEPLVLPLGPDCSERVMARKDFPHPGMQTVKTILRARFMGAEVVADTGGEYEWYDSLAKAAAEAAAAAQRAEYEARRKEEAEFVRAFPREKFFEKATRRDIGRLRSGRLSVVDFARRVVKEVGEEVLGRIDYRVVYDAEEDELEKIRKEILEREEILREERKKQWLAKASQGGER